jgi:VIT1/CCC1 family predicted Fe2+/Mn2+ transporter
MPYPIVREILIVFCTVAGTLVGWLAGRSISIPAAEMSLAFVGMALGGAFADICTRKE